MTRGPVERALRAIAGIPESEDDATALARLETSGDAGGLRACPLCLIRPAGDPRNPLGYDLPPHLATGWSPGPTRHAPGCIIAAGLASFRT